MRTIYQKWSQVGDALWQDFHQTDPAQHAWYYRAIAEATREFEGSLAWREYDALIRIVFEEGTTL